MIFTRYLLVRGLVFMDKKKKVLLFTGIGLDVALTCFLFVVSIIMLATMPEKGQEPKLGGMIGWFQKNPTMYLIIGVIPLFLLLILNIVLLVLYVKKAGQKKAVEVSDLDQAQMDALKAELLKDLAGSSEDKKE